MFNKMLRLIRRYQIKTHHFRSKFDIVIQNKVPHLKVSKKHEKSVKWILRILIAVGIGTSIIAFPSWYSSLIFSLALFLIEQIFEKIIFTHNVMLVQPLPKSWDGSKWTAMIIASDGLDATLGFAFSDRKVGTDFFDTLFAWNEDRERNAGNIQLTLVQEDKNCYSVHIYPTAKRPFVTENYQIAQKRFDKKINAGKELDVLIVQICFCKVFPMSPNCAYNFLKGNSHNIPVQIFDSSKVIISDPTTYRNVTLMDDRALFFEDITVCKRKELDRQKNPMEYYHVPEY